MKALSSFIDRTRYANLQLVVADDGSPKEMQAEMRMLPIDKLVASEKNRGLGANTNAGLKQCVGRYVLQIQDDWECSGPAHFLEESVRLMETHSEVGLVKFYGDQHGEDGRTRVWDFDGAECYFIPAVSSSPRPAYKIYSDTPHLKRKELVDFLGEYRERCRMEECEVDYQNRFTRQSRYKAAFFPAYYNKVFTHVGAHESFRTRSPLRRFETALAPIVRRVGEARPDLYGDAKSIYKGGVRLLYRLGIFRA